VCYVYSSLVSAPSGLQGSAAPAPLRSYLDLYQFFIKASVKDNAHGLGRETQTQLTPQQPNHAAVPNLLETAVSTSF